MSVQQQHQEEMLFNILQMDLDRVFYHQLTKLVVEKSKFKRISISNLL